MDSGCPYPIAAGAGCVAQDPGICCGKGRGWCSAESWGP